MRDQHTELGRGPCQFRAQCHNGCSYGAYFSSLSATLPAAMKTGNLTVVTNAIVHSVIHDPKTNRVTGVRVMDARSKRRRSYNARMVFLNASTIPTAQRKALKEYVESGGGFVGLHGAGGDSSYKWRWYVEELIGAQFSGHPITPHIQPAKITVEDRQHPATSGLPALWQRSDEWYSFAKTPRKPGFHILATLDETSYKPRVFFGRGLAMGDDHPIAWWHCTGKGHVFYSALGHTAQSYAEPLYRGMIAGAVEWAMRADACSGAPPAAAGQAIPK